MQELKRIITELKMTPGKNDKQNILSKNSNNNLLRFILAFVYDPMILSGLSSRKINKVVRLPPTHYSFRCKTASNIYQITIPEPIKTLQISKTSSTAYIRPIKECALIS